MGGRRWSARLVAIAAGVLVSATARADPPRIRVGVVPGPHAEVMKVVQAVAAERGLHLEIVFGRDPSRLNAMLASGRLDANSCQDLAALEADAAAHGWSLASVGTTITLPMAFYSSHLRSFRDLKTGDAIALPREPADRGRALILLHNYGLIELRDGAGLRATTADVASNPRALKLVLLPEQRLARARGTLAAVALPWPVAAAAGLRPPLDAIGTEDARSPWASVLAVRGEDREKPWVTALVRGYQSAKVAEFIWTAYRDSVRRPW